MSTYQTTPTSNSPRFQNAILNRIDSAMEALETLSELAEQFRHADLQKIADDAFNAIQDARIKGQRYTGPTFVCENCKGSFRGDGRYYPGSIVANQSTMERVCVPCERLLMDVAARALAAAPSCRDCGLGSAVFPQTGRCWPCHEKAARAGSAPPRAVEQPAAAPTTILTPFAYQMLARADKARLMAKILFRGGVPSIDVARMTAEDWKQFHAGLKAKGIGGPHSTVPSDQSIAMVIVEMRRLEAAAMRPAIATRYATIAPGLAVRVGRRWVA